MDYDVVKVDAKDVVRCLGWWVVEGACGVLPFFATLRACSAAAVR